MNKTELVNYIAEKSEGGFSKKQAEDALNLVLDGMVHALENGEKVQLVGYLTLEPVARAARKGYNPQTEEEIHIPASMGVRAKAGKKLSNAVTELEISDFIKEK